MNIKQVNLNKLVIDENIYPRSAVNIKRVELFAENLRDGICFIV
ncbi:hypothetical protein MHK_005998 [Candidatus Magnetomorum sp. HK-1]|nr:hypothetical protein MHK_005998 [Candidatus Magnetomorum sp. HK-1]